MPRRALKLRSSRQDQLDRLFGALADRTRRALLERLARGPAPVTELALPFAMSLPAVSRHLKVLEQAGLVTRSVDGRIHRCSLSPQPLQEIGRWVEQQRGFWEGSLKSLARYVEGQGKQKRRSAGNDP